MQISVCEPLVCPEPTRARDTANQSQRERKTESPRARTAQRLRTAESQRERKTESPRARTAQRLRTAESQRERKTESPRARDTQTPPRLLKGACKKPTNQGHCPEPDLKSKALWQTAKGAERAKGGKVGKRESQSRTKADAPKGKHHIKRLAGKPRGGIKGRGWAKAKMGGNAKGDARACKFGGAWGQKSGLLSHERNAHIRQ